MLTLRGLPPAAVDHPDPLLAAYFAPLIARWDTRERTAARMIDRCWVGVGAEEPARRFGIPMGEWPLCRGQVAAGGYVSMAARKGMHRVINPGAFPLKANHFKDKSLFARAAADAGLPIPDTLVDEPDAAEWLTRHETVMVKPSFSSKGEGIHRYRRARNVWFGSDGRQHGDVAFARIVSNMLRARGVVQAAATTDAAYGDISPGALPTLRVVTLRDEAGNPEVAMRVLRVGGGVRPVDNFGAGGLAMVIAADGSAGTAFSMAADGGISETRRHPQTGARLDLGVASDLLRRCDAIAVAGHRALGCGYATIAWDVGLSDAGPILIEGNWNPGTDIMQVLGREPLSSGRTGALYRLALAAVPCEVWAAAKPVQRDGL